MIVFTCDEDGFAFLQKEVSVYEYKYMGIHILIMPYEKIISYSGHFTSLYHHQQHEQHVQGSCTWLKDPQTSRIIWDSMESRAYTS